MTPKSRVVEPVRLLTPPALPQVGIQSRKRLDLPTSNNTLSSGQNALC